MTSRRDLLKGLAAGSLSGLIGPSLLGVTKAAAQGVSALGFDPVVSSARAPDGRAASVASREG